MRNGGGDTVPNGDPLATTAHRPWPVPSGPWAWRQTWHDVLFAHWPVPVSQLRPLVPDSLELQTRGGMAWLGVVPFHMSGIARRPLPPLPGVRAFPELNVRTYVEHGGKPGVWFFSLDAANRLAVWVARVFYHLPYRRARMQVRRREAPGGGVRIRYSSERRDEPRGLGFRARYGPVGGELDPDPGSLARWLTERYCLYSVDRRGRLHRAEIHHPPWPLRPAEVALDQNDVARPLGLGIDGSPALVHYAERLHVRVWRLRPVRAR